MRGPRSRRLRAGPARHTEVVGDQLTATEGVAITSGRRRFGFGAVTITGMSSSAP